MSKLDKKAGKKFECCLPSATLNSNLLRGASLPLVSLPTSRDEFITNLGFRNYFALRLGLPVLKNSPVFKKPKVCACNLTFHDNSWGNHLLADGCHGFKDNAKTTRHTKIGNTFKTCLEVLGIHVEKEITISSTSRVDAFAQSPKAIMKSQLLDYACLHPVAKSNVIVA